MSAFCFESHLCDLEQNVGIRKNEEIINEVVVSHLIRMLDLSGTQLDDLRWEPEVSFKGSTYQLSGWKKSLSFSRKKEPNLLECHLSSDNMQQVQQLIEYIKNNLTVEEIFLKSGNALRQEQLLTALSTGACINFDRSHFHVYDVANVLKRIFEQLPEPLLFPSKHLYSHLQISKMNRFDHEKQQSFPDIEKRIESLQLLLLLLPSNNRKVLQSLLSLLYQISKHHKVNQMTISCLSKVFTPLIFFPNSGQTSEVHENVTSLNNHVAFMISFVERIFTMPSYVKQSVDRCIAQSKESLVSHSTLPSQFTVANMKPEPQPLKQTASVNRHYETRSQSALKLRNSSSTSSSLKKKKCGKSSSSDKLFRKTRKSNEKQTKIFNKSFLKKSLQVENFQSYYRFSQPGDDSLPLVESEKENVKINVSKKETTALNNCTPNESKLSLTDQLKNVDFAATSFAQLAIKPHRGVQPFKSSTPRRQTSNSSEISNRPQKRQNKIIKITMV